MKTIIFEYDIPYGKVIFYNDGTYKFSDYKEGNYSLWKIEECVLLYRHRVGTPWIKWHDLEYKNELTDTHMRLSEAFFKHLSEVEFEKAFLNHKEEENDTLS